MEKRKVTVLDNEYYQKQMAVRDRRRQRREREHRYRLFSRACIAVMIMSVACAALMIGRDMIDRNRLEVQRDAARAKMNHAKKTNSGLDLKVRQLSDEEYVQKLIRKKYLYSRNNEIIFTLPGSGRNN